MKGKDSIVVAQGSKQVGQLGQRILKTVQAEVNRDRANKASVEIAYDDYCDWHDSGTGDCEN